MEYGLRKIEYEGDTSSGVCVIRPVSAEYKSPGGYSGPVLDALRHDHQNEDGKVFFANVLIENWNVELSPWEAPPVFGDERFGAGADELLAFITRELIPHTDRTYGKKKYVIMGYSMAGLFALYAVYNSDLFDAVAAVSPSGWFPGWIEYAREHDPLARYVYLSLGEKEEFNNNAIMSSVGSRIRCMEHILQEKGIPVTLEWNPGGHFRNPDIRMAKGVGSVLLNISPENNETA
ncbi:MAG: esterase [Lachnospiraceae bacterium]|nr:esterase [Lachnospiraceae bacterium]